MTLTAEDIKRLEMPLPLEDHEARAKGKNKAGTQQQWLIYITQEGVIPLLNSIDPNWTWDVRDSSKWDKYAVVTGRLTIKDVFRDGRGGNSPNSASASTDEDTEKGAETDALKRAAVKFGVGLYLRGAPAIWLPYAESNKPWEDEQKALAEFAKWYNREFRQQNAQNGKQAQPPPQSPPAQPSAVGGAETRPLANTPPTAPISGNGGSSAKDELFPDTSPVKRYVCTEIRVVPFGKGKQAQLRREDGGDPIVLLGREKLVAAGYPKDEVDHWIGNLNTWFPLKPSADVEAAFDGAAWDVGEIHQLETEGVGK